MSQSSYSSSSMGILLTLLLSAQAPAFAEVKTATKKVVTISREQLQDRSVRALKQIDVCESIIDTFGQFLANIKGKLSDEKKTEISYNLQSLRKQMGIIKDAYAIHIDANQLVGLVNLTGEVARVLTAAVNSGLEVIPKFNEKVLATKTAGETSLKEIDLLLLTNDKRLQKLSDLSEKVGLTNLNRMYRGARKFYRKYYVWPIMERVIVYTAFIHWAIFVTSDWKLEEIDDTFQVEKTTPVIGKNGKAVRDKNGKIQTQVEVIKDINGKPLQDTFYKKMMRPITGWLRQKKNGYEVEVVQPILGPDGKPRMNDDGSYHFSIIKNKHKGIGGPGFGTEYSEERKAVFVRPARDTNGNKLFTEIDGKVVNQLECVPASEIAYMHKTDGHGRVVPGKQTPILPGQLKGDVIESSIVNTVKGGSSPHGWGNVIEDPFSAIVKLDHKSPLAVVPVGTLFANYMRKDFEIISKQCSKIGERLDDILYGTTKKRSYETLTMPDERFENIVGREEVKAELRKVVEYICSPDKFQRAGIKVEKGYLLAGDPQTGKTYMAKALTGEINDALKKMGRNDKMRLFEISTDALISKGIAHYMDLARYHAPCILFLDELDLLRLQRDGDSKLLSEFLTSMSGTLSKDEKSHVIILAATNKPENLDFALRQHGRFGKMFWFDKPTFNHRVEFFQKECNKRCMNIERFNFNELAKQTEGCSFGSLDIVMKKALMLAKLSGSSVTQEHFDKALDCEIKQMIPHGYNVPKEKEEVIAVHHAGKAIMSAVLEPQKKLSKVTVLPITQDLQEKHVTQQYNIAGLQSEDQRAIRHGGIFSYNWSDSLNLVSQDELKKQCKILLAGNIAQTVYGLPSPSYDKQDKQEAFKLAKQIVFEGLDQKEIAKAIREEKLTEAYRLVEQYEYEIAQQLDEHKAWLVATTQALQERKTLSVGELKELQGKV